MKKETKEDIAVNYFIGLALLALSICIGTIIFQVYQHIGLLWAVGSALFIGSLLWSIKQLEL